MSSKRDIPNLFATASACLFATSVFAVPIYTGDATGPDPLTAGTGGNTGTITIAGGDMVFTPSWAQIGSGLGSDGELNLSGPGTLLSVGGVSGFFMDVGVDHGVGRVIVEDGATLTIDAFIDPGFSDARFNIGRRGTGEVTIQSGAQVFVRDQNLTGQDDGIFVGTSNSNVSESPGNGILTIQDEGTYVEVSGNLGFLNAGAVFEGSLGANGTINILNGADVLVDGNDNIGTMNFGRGAGATGILNVSGTGTTVEITGAAGLLAIGNSFGVAEGGTGILNVSDNAVIDVNGFGSNGGLFSVGSNGQSMSFATIDSGARVNVNGSSNDPSSGGLVSIGANNSAGAILTVNDTGFLAANTTFVVDNGILAGNGTIQSNVINSGGTIAPGASPGTLTIDGDLVMDDGALVIEVGGLGAGEFDQLVVNGDADFLGGDVIFQFVGGFAPSTGNSLTFLIVSELFFIDDAVNFSFSGLAAGFEFMVDTTGSGFEFTALNDGIFVPLPGAFFVFASALFSLSGLRRRSGRRHDRSKSRTPGRLSADNA